MKKTCSSCKQPVTKKDIKAICSCGHIYCKGCLGIMTPQELEIAVIEVKYKTNGKCNLKIVN